MLWSFVKLSGSDDYNWASLALLDACDLLNSTKYLSYKGLYYERGALDSWSYVNKVYTNSTYNVVFWGLT